MLGLGIRRTGVSGLASQFSRSGIISCKRGLIQIVDVKKLEACACECYQLVACEFPLLLSVRSKYLINWF